MDGGRDPRDTPNVDLEPVGDQKLDGVHMATEVQRRVALVVRGQEVSTKLVQQLADVHVATGRSEVQPRAAAAVADVGVEATFQQALGVVEVTIDAGLQQGDAGLRRVVHEDVGHGGASGDKGPGQLERLGWDSSSPPSLLPHPSPISPFLLLLLSPFSLSLISILPPSLLLLSLSPPLLHLLLFLLLRLRHHRKTTVVCGDAVWRGAKASGMF